MLGFVLTRDKVKIKEKGEGKKNKGRKKKDGWLLSQPSASCPEGPGLLTPPFTPPGPGTREAQVTVLSLTGPDYLAQREGRRTSRVKGSAEWRQKAESSVTGGAGRT